MTSVKFPESPFSINIEHVDGVVGVIVGVLITARDWVGAEESAGDRVVESPAHKDDSGEGVGRALFNTEPAVTYWVGGVLGAGSAVFGGFEVRIRAGGGGAVVDGGNDVAVRVGQL